MNIDKMSNNEKIYYFFFKKKLDFFTVANMVGISSISLKSKIIKIGLRHCKDIDLISEELRLKGIKFYHVNYNFIKTKKISFMNSRDKTIIERIQRAFIDYDSIHFLIKKDLEKGNGRASTAKKYAVSVPVTYQADYNSSFCRTQNKINKLSDGQISKIIDFEKTYFQGRTISNEMKILLKRVGKLEKYETKKATF